MTGSKGKPDEINETSNEMPFFSHWLMESLINVILNAYKFFSLSHPFINEEPKRFSDQA